MGIRYHTVANRAEAEALTNVPEGCIVINTELDAKMAYGNGKWVTFTDGMSMKSKLLQGLILCLTGTAWTSRAKVEDMIRAEGGKPIQSMTSKSIILVNAHLGRDAVQTTAKVVRAKQLGAKIISSNDLRAVLNGDVTIQEMLNGTQKRKPAEPIDRERQRKIVQSALADIESIAFGK